MNLQKLQESIHRIYEGNTDYYSSGEEDYDLRLGYINDSISKWEQEEGIQWRELFVTLESAVDGDKSTTSGTSTLTTPSNFIEISSKVKVGDSYYSFISNNKVLLSNLIEPSKKYFYITGSPSAYKINILPEIDETGLEVDYSYYKQATILEDSTDIPEMSKPLYIVYDVVAQLYELDNRNDLVNKYLQLSAKLINEMVISNETPPEFNGVSLLDDESYQLNQVRFGK